MNLNINSLKLLKVKGGYGLTLVFNEPDAVGAPSDGNRNWRGLIHPDLMAALQALRIHFAILSDYVTYAQCPDIAAPGPELTEKFHVNGYNIGGEDETLGFKISGYKITHRKVAQNWLTGFDKFEGSPEARYQYIADLQAKLRVIEFEVDRYLSGQKRGEPNKVEEPPVEESKDSQADLFQQEKEGEVNGEVVNKAQILPPASGTADNDSIPGADKKKVNLDKKGNKRVAQTSKHKNGLAGKK
jgi:hypothetical protein